MQIQQSKDGKNGRVAETPDRAQRPRLRGFDLGALEHRREEKFERVDVKQDEEQQRLIEEHHPMGLQCVAAEETIVLVPYVRQQGETDTKGKEAMHGNHEFWIS